MGSLNRSRPYSTVFGIANHSFEQNGKKFNQMGEEVDNDGNLVEEVKTPEPEKSAFSLPPESEVESGFTLDEKIDESKEADRDSIMSELDKLGINYDKRLRRSTLLEILKNNEPGRQPGF